MPFERLVESVPSDRDAGVCDEHSSTSDEPLSSVSAKCPLFPEGSNKLASSVVAEALSASSISRAEARALGSCTSKSETIAEKRAGSNGGQYSF